MSIFQGFWETAERINERKARILSTPAKPAETVTVQYFDSQKRACEKVISLAEYQMLASQPPDASLAVNYYIAELKGV